MIQCGRVIRNKAQFFDSFCVPPFMGYVLAHIGDYEIEESLQKISEKLGIRVETVRRFISQITDNQESKSFVIDDDLSIILPPLLLSTSDEKQTVNIWESQDFNFGADYTIERPQMPISINLMVTTQCTTDCIYCYANRSLRPIMNTDKILELIKDMYEGGVLNITLTGGDILTRNDWPCILRKLREYGYFPYISTKTPLDEMEIITLIEFNHYSVTPN